MLCKVNAILYIQYLHWFMSIKVKKKPIKITGVSIELLKNDKKPEKGD